MEETGLRFFKENGYHGTNAKNVESIQANNFWESVDHSQWFGDGVYFFVNGLHQPANAAFSFVEDNAKRDRESYEIAVLEAAINVDNNSFLDLTQHDGLQLINSFREELLSKIELIGKKPSTTFQDHHLIQSMRRLLDIEFVKGHVYIKFGIQRNKGFFSRIPNVTIFVVSNPGKNIDIRSIKRVA